MFPGGSDRLSFHVQHPRALSQSSHGCQFSRLALARQVCAHKAPSHPNPPRNRAVGAVVFHVKHHP